LERDLKQLPLVDSAETTHHSPAKPTVVSTSTDRSLYIEIQCMCLRQTETARTDRVIDRSLPPLTAAIHYK